MRATPSAASSRGARLGGGPALGRHRRQMQLAGGYALGDLLRTAARAQHEIHEGAHDAAGQQVARLLHDHVHERHVDLVDAADAQQPQGGALGGVGGVVFDVALDVVGDGVGRGACAVRKAGVQLECVVHVHTLFRQGKAGSARRAVAAVAAAAASPLTTSYTGTRPATASATAVKNTVGW